MARSSSLTFIPVIPLYWAEKEISHINNDALKALILDNRNLKKPGSCPDDANFEDIVLDPRALCSDVLDSLLAEVDAAIKEVSSAPLKLEGGMAWANMRVKGQSLAYHDHEDPNNPNVDRLSFVYYVQANSDNQPLVYPISLYTHRFDKGFTPKTGKLQIFPSFLPHYTGQENAPSVDRIVIAGNYGPA